ncbi:MAG: ADP-ribosylglycohydrolase family protein [Planctomycetota bacterium]
MKNDSRIAGCVLETAVGDAIGLPYEGVSRRRLLRLLGPPERHRFFFGRGMISDDTEHTCLIVQSLMHAGDDVDVFARDFARRLRWWFASLPAGIGRATLRSCLKLWLGVSPDRSGVFSAGNGPAMRSAIIGAWFANVHKMVEFVRASTRITHTDPKAEYGAIAVALAAHFGSNDMAVDGELYREQLAELIGPDGSELLGLIDEAIASVSAGQSTLQFADAMGLGHGVTGYTYHTVPIVIHAWLSHHHDYRAAVSAVIECGGDADTTAAIVGGIVGAAKGESAIPREWLANVCDWPRAVGWMRKLSLQADSCSVGSAIRPISTNYFANLFRNLIFLTIVLYHGFRRLFPPY